MSEALTIESNAALQVGGVGMGANIFKAKPGMIELVHKSSRQENVKYGEFRIIGNNEHLGHTIKVVLLAVPQTQREWFVQKDVFTKENKGCFSLDGVQPHPNASQPPALYCSTCPKGDLNWATWRKTKNPNDLPPCNAYWHLLLALRDTGLPYYLNIKGKSYKPFLDAMQQQMQPMLAKLLANVKAENKPRGYALVNQEFKPIPGFVVPDGQTQKPPIPSPNIFDVSFNISSTSKDGGPFMMKFDDFKWMARPEDRAEFGNLYLEMQAAREQKVEVNEEAEAAAAVSETKAEADFAAPAKAVQEILPPIVI